MLAICIFLGSMATARAQIESYIVGGEFTSIYKYPHSAFLSVHCVTGAPDFRNSSWICGASIINQRLLITAAHCLYPCGVKTRISVNMGDKNMHGGIVKSVSQFIYHERYIPMINCFDIGMLKLKKAIDFNARIRRVAIMRNPPYDEPASLAGWGLINEKTDAYSLEIKSVPEKIWKRRACQQILGTLPSGTICASSPKLKEFASRGDSGSALVVRGYIQIGLVSYKVPGLGNNLIVFSDVGHYYDWIDFNAKRLFCGS